MEMVYTFICEFATEITEIRGNHSRYREEDECRIWAACGEIAINWYWRNYMLFDWCLCKIKSGNSYHKQSEDTISWIFVCCFKESVRMLVDLKSRTDFFSNFWN